MTSIWETFETLATTGANVDALVAPDRQSLRFSQLAPRLLHVRDALAEFGVGTEDRVVGVLPRGPETAVCYLAVAACASYAPLNPDYTESEFKAYLANLAPRAIILPGGVDHPARRAARKLGISAIDLSIDLQQPAGFFSLACQKPAGKPVEPCWGTADHTALVLQTSGTTGHSKFVPCRQRHLLAFAEDEGRLCATTSSDRCLHIMPMFHGQGLKMTLFNPLANGSGVICPPQFDIPIFFEAMRTQRPTWYSAAASIHRAIADRIDDYRDIAKQAKLRYIRSGSSKLDAEVLRILEEAFDAPVLDRYGGSETCVVTSNGIRPELRKRGTVGKATVNDVKIIDDDGNFLPLTGDGEIVVRGPTIFDGYLNDTEANAKAFMNGWFRTGDLGRFDEEGYLTLIGRKKDLINRGGEKIGAGEVEAAISRHPAIAEVCVFSVPHVTLGEEIAAAVVAAPGQHVSEAEIRDHGRGLLASFKVPRLVFVLPSLPKSATAKIRRDEVAKICHELLLTRLDARDSDSQRWSAIEQEIAELWADVLKIPATRIHSDDDFFLIGGDSLKAFELFILIERQYRITLGLRHIFDEATTVPGMARLVEHARKSKPEPAMLAAGLVPIRIEGDRPPLFGVPGSGGNPLGFVHLGRLMDQRQPFIGIEFRGMDGSMRPLNRIEDIAADNISRIKMLQPSGPYFLTGSCYGARVAFEMASQLEAANEEVGLLLMLDPSPPFHGRDGRPHGASQVTATASVRRSAQKARFLLGRAFVHASSIVKLRGQERKEYIRQRLGALFIHIGQRNPFTDDHSVFSQRAVYEANLAAGRVYIPGSFKGRTIVCFTRGRPVPGPRNYRLDWQQVVPQAGDPIFVPGINSGDMINVPNIYELVPLVNRWLDQAYEASGPAGQVANHGPDGCAAEPKQKIPFCEE